MQQIGSRFGAAIKVAQRVVLGLVLGGCASAKNPEGSYEMEPLAVQNGQDPVLGFLELKKGGVLAAHWQLPDTAIAVLSGYRETPEERRHQTKHSAEHFAGTWETSGSAVVLSIAGKGPTCQLGVEGLECVSGNATKQTFRALAADKAPPKWVKAGKLIDLGKGAEAGKPFGEWNEGERLAIKIQAEKGSSTHGLRADIKLRDKQARGGIFTPKTLRLQIAYPPLGEWPVATMTFENEVTCEAAKSETELTKSPVAFLRGRPSVLVRRVDMEFGCSKCSSCQSQVETKTLTFLPAH
jgi:hypothetical protein